MAAKPEKLLRKRLSGEDYGKLARLRNAALNQFISDYLQLCNPSKIFLSSGSKKEMEFIRKEALGNCEELPLAMKGHTLHFDNYEDQGRARGDTAILLPKGESLGSFIFTKDREEGLEEMISLLRGSMKGRTMYIQFHALGPENSVFSIPCIQITDSAYVAHNENLLYRQGYAEFVRQGPATHFLKFIHSTGELEKGGNGCAFSRNTGKRRIYIDLKDETVYGANTTYGGNSIGLKKLAMRLTIHRASQEGWLTEHMLIMGIHGPRGRVSYFTGAFPSMCGKTSTAMLSGEKIVGDDIAYLRVRDGRIRAANVEQGMFGIIANVNEIDDPLIWKALHSPGELIFSNILLLPGGKVFWSGSGKEIPREGINHSGKWIRGKKDNEGRQIDSSHKNARFTISLRAFENLDKNLDSPQGVPVSGIIYGGRDSDTSPPILQSFNWEHGVIAMGASLESEKTAATLGGEGQREFNPMANLDFLSIPIGRYVRDHLNFGASAQKVPPIFSVNYFLKEGGKFLNSKMDKAVWLKWMELRAHKEVGAIKTPAGHIPKYSDLRKLFKKFLGTNYFRSAYDKQFKLRVPENLKKIERITQIYKTKIPDAPPALFRILRGQKKRLLAAQREYGDYITPEKFEK